MRRCVQTFDWYCIWKTYLVPILFHFLSLLEILISKLSISAYVNAMYNMKHFQTNLSKSHCCGWVIARAVLCSAGDSGCWQLSLGCLCRCSDVYLCVRSPSDLWRPEEFSCSRSCVHRCVWEGVSPAGRNERDVSSVDGAGGCWCCSDSELSSYTASTRPSSRRLPSGSASTLHYTFWKAWQQKLHQHRPAHCSGHCQASLQWQHIKCPRSHHVLPCRLFHSPEEPSPNLPASQRLRKRKMKILALWYRTVTLTQIQAVVFRVNQSLKISQQLDNEVLHKPERNILLFYNPISITNICNMSGWCVFGYNHNVY